MILEDPGIYYEVHGQGKPLVLLNGIMMNTLSWVDHIERLKDHFQLIIYDMRDQAQSAKMGEGYDISIHAEDLKKLLEHLQWDKVDIWGVSYGGQVGMIFTLKYPEMVDRLVLSNTSAHVDQYLSSLGDLWKRAARLYDGEAFFDLALIPIYSRNFYNTRYDWLLERRKLFKDFLTKEWFDGFIRLASSNATYDIRGEISKIKKQALLIAAEEDIITPYSQMREIDESMPNSKFVCIPNAGHAAFLEKIDEVCTLIKGFLL
jgi:pimeloyl-ACP methyl ester carboxylesterase